MYMLITMIIQVANYGLGGHFDAHYDALLKDIPLDSPAHKVMMMLMIIIDCVHNDHHHQLGSLLNVPLQSAEEKRIK